MADRIEAAIGPEESDVGGVGGTLAANVLSLAAVRATLEHVLTEEAFARMIALGERFEQGVQGVIEGSQLPWHVTRLGLPGRVPLPQGAAGDRKRRRGRGDPLLDRLIHLYALNRGVLLTLFATLR